MNKAQSGYGSKWLYSHMGKEYKILAFEQVYLDFLLKNLVVRRKFLTNV